MQTHSFKLKKQQHDSRDLVLMLPDAAAIVSVDLRPIMPPILDQGSLGACGSNATANALRYLLKKELHHDFTPSRLFLYYNTRVSIENQPADKDTGVALRDVCKALTKWHACDEAYWPYVVTKFSMTPSAEAYRNARQHMPIAYYAVHGNLSSLTSALAHGFPVIFAIEMYESFRSPEAMRTGAVPMPDTEKERLLGGHALLCCGYQADVQRFIVANSWSASVGDHGYFYLPEAYVLSPKLAGDFWALTTFE